MRYAIISDIHANLEALTVVLEQIDQARVDRIICLGDLVGYYANPNECINIIRERKIPCIAGNHDRVVAGVYEPTRFGPAARKAIYWTRDCLTEDNRLFLDGLPTSDCVDDQFLIVHASLDPEPNEVTYMNSPCATVSSFERLLHYSPGVKVCFFGHTHRSKVYAYQDGIVSIENSLTIKLARSACYMINPGSVGQPRDGDNRAAFIIFDSEAKTVQLHRAEYDIDLCFRKAAQAGVLYKESLRSQLANWLDISRGLIGLPCKYDHS